MRRPAAGFTLLEILVVLVLTSLVVAILLQGLQQVYRLQTHFGAETFNAQQGAMRIDWFRSSANGIMPDYLDGKSRFKGTSRRMSGQTSAPLDAPEGALVPFVWRIEFDARIGETVLRSGDGAESPVVLSWPGNDGRFLYVDQDGRDHDIWPPYAGKPATQVPLMILLEMGETGHGRRIVAVPRGPEKPWPRQADVLAG